MGATLPDGPFKYDVFVSYSARDGVDENILPFVRDLRSAIENRSGSPVRIFFDREHLQFGDQITDTISDAVQSSRVFLALTSPWYVNSPWNRREVALAQESNAEVLVAELLPSGPSTLRFDHALRGRLWDRSTRSLLRDGRDYDRAVNGLADVIYEKLRSDEVTTSSGAPSKPALLVQAEREAPRPPIARQPLKIFVSYCHADGNWLTQLKTHLVPYMRNGTLDVWDDKRIGAGENWLKAIERAMAEASVAVLLVTPHFMASDFVQTKEVPDLLKAASDGGLTVFWIAVDHCAYETSAIAGYQCANDPSRPLRKLSGANRSETLTRIARKLAATAE